jgi:hypothetical protein
MILIEKGQSMINTSGITDTKFATDHSSVEVTHADGTVATYTGDDLYTICEEMLSASHRKIIRKDENGQFTTEIYPVKS